MRATSVFFTPSTDNVNGLTSSHDELSEEAEIPATGRAVLTKGGGESKDSNTVVADTGMKESQSEEDDSSNLESFKNPDSLKLPEGVEESLNGGEEKEEDHNLENAPAATEFVVFLLFLSVVETFFHSLGEFWRVRIFETL